MSCIGKFQTADGFKVSGSYYALTNISGPLVGKALYESAYSSRYENAMGFDPSAEKPSFVSNLNGLGEPSAKNILNFNNVETSPEVKEGLTLIEELVQKKLVAHPLPRKAAEMQLTLHNLNPRFDLVSLELVERGTSAYLKAKVSPNRPPQTINKEHLEKLKFNPIVIGAIDDNGKGFLNSLINSLLTLEDLPSFQREMLNVFRRFNTKNPTLQIVINDKTLDPVDKSYYNPRTNTIYIAKDAYVSQSLENLIKDLLHESSHAYTLSALNNPTTPEERRFKEAMEGLFKKYREAVLHPEFSYGFKNVEEFVAEFMSNPNFREHIEQLDSFLKKPSNFISEFFQAVKSLLRSLFGYQAVDTKSEIEQEIEAYLDYLERRQDIPDSLTENHLRFVQGRFTPEERASQLAAKKLNRPNKKTQFRIFGILFPDIKKSYSRLLGQHRDLLKNKTIDELAQELPKYLFSVLSFNNNINTGINRIRNFKDHVAYKIIFELRTSVGKEMLDNVKGIISYLEALDKEDLQNPELEAYFYNLFKNELESFFAAQPEGNRVSVNLKETPTLKNLVSVIKKIFPNIENKDNLFSDETNAILKEYSKRIVYDSLVSSFKDAGTMDSLIKSIEDELQYIEKITNKSAAELNKPDSDYGDYRRLTSLVTKLKNATENASKEDYVQAISDLFEIDNYVNKSVLNITSPLFISGRLVSNLFASYIENSKIKDDDGLFLKYRDELFSIKSLLDKLSPIIGATGTRYFTASYYKDVVVEREIHQLMDDGKIKKVKKAFLNTEVDFVRFNNDLVQISSEKRLIETKIQEIEDRLETLQPGQDIDALLAEREDLQNQLEEAKQKESDFFSNNVERQYIDRYYEIQDIVLQDRNGIEDELGRNLRETMDEYQQELNELESLKGMHTSLLYEDTIYQRIQSIKSEILEMRNYFDKDGKRKSNEQVEIARRLNAYYQALQNEKVFLSDLTQENRETFEAQKKVYTDKLSRIANEIGLNSGIDSNEFEKSELTRLTEEQKKVQEEYRTWLRQYTKRRITPDFWTDVFEPIIEQIKSITGETNPKIKQWQEAIRRAIAPKKDEDGIPNGNLFSDGEAQTVKQLELLIKAYREEKTKNGSNPVLEGLFKKLSQIYETKPSFYYEEELNKRLGDIQNGIQFSDEGKKLKKLAEEAVEDITRILAGEAPVNKDNPVFTELLDIKEAEQQILAGDYVDAENTIYFALLIYQSNQELRETDWYQNNHIIEESPSIPKTNLLGEVVSPKKYNDKPIAIWMDSIPTDTQYVEQNGPNGLWETHVVNPVFINPDYKNGKTPKKSIYVNPQYQNVSQERKEIINRLVSFIDKLHEDLPDFYQLENYALPTKRIGFVELTTPVRNISMIEKVWKVPTSPIVRFFKETFFANLDRGSEYAGVEDVASKESVLSGTLSPHRLYKDASMSISEQSLDLLSLLFQYSSHTITTKRLLETIPTTTFFREMVEEKKDINDAEEKEINRFIQRIYLGNGNLLYANTYNKSFWQEINDPNGNTLNALAKGTGLIIKRFITTPLSKSALLLNFVRAINQLSQIPKVFIGLVQSGFSKREILKYIIKRMVSFRTNYNLHMGLGGKEAKKDLLLNIEFNISPDSERHKVATKGISSGFERFSILGALRVLTIQHVDYIPSAVVGDLHLNKRFEIQGEMVKVKDMFEKENGKLVIAQRFRNNPDSVKKIKDIKNRTIDNIREDNYRTSGQYWDWSRSSWQEMASLRLVFFLKGSWLFPGVTNYYGGSRVATNAGRLHHSIYFGDMKMRMKLLSKGRLRSSLFLNTRRTGVSNSPIVYDTAASLMSRAVSYYAQGYLFFLLTNMIAKAAGEDDWEEKLKKFLGIKFLMGLIGMSDELNTITNPLVMTYNIGNEFINYPSYSAYQDRTKNAVSKTLNFAIDKAVGQTTYSALQRMSIFFDPKLYADPFDSKYEYTETGYLPKIYGKKYPTAQLLDKFFGINKTYEKEDAPTRLSTALSALLYLGPIDNTLAPEVQAKNRMIYGSVNLFGANPFQDVRRLTSELETLGTDFNDVLRNYFGISKGKYVTRNLSFSEKREYERKLKEIQSGFLEKGKLLNKLLAENKILREEEFKLSFQTSVSSSTQDRRELAFNTIEMSEHKSELDELAKQYREDRGILDLIEKMKDTYNFLTIKNYGKTYEGILEKRKEDRKKEKEETKPQKPTKPKVPAAKPSNNSRGGRYGR
jgi:hypothetical protein